eukprot:13809515-Heterocapsa_arctica.AAC.1
MSCREDALSSSSCKYSRSVLARKDVSSLDKCQGASGSRSLGTQKGSTIWLEGGCHQLARGG